MSDLNFSELEQEIGYTFRDKSYLRTALTHSSYKNEHRDIGDCNERLEFLGDSVLSLISSDFLFLHTTGDEGSLTRLKALLVCEATLSEFAKDIRLGTFLLLGKGEEPVGRTRPSILSDALEALIGAIYLDGGMENARNFVEPLLTRGMQEHTQVKDYKTLLQEIVQKNKGETLRYEIASESGPEHNKTFVCNVYINSNPVGQGTGKSKKAAEQDGAKNALALMGIHP